MALIIATTASAFTIPPMNALATRSVPPSGESVSLPAAADPGLILAVAAGLIVARVLGDSGPGFPRSLALIVLAAAASVAAGTFLVGLIREPARLQPHTTPALGEAIGIAPSTNSGVPSFPALSRTLTALSASFDPLIILFGLQQLSIPFGYVGYYVAVFAGVRLLTEPELGVACAIRRTSRSFFRQRPSCGCSRSVSRSSSVIDLDLWRDNISNNAPSRLGSPLRCSARRLVQDSCAAATAISTRRSPKTIALRLGAHQQRAYDCRLRSDHNPWDVTDSGFERLFVAGTLLTLVTPLPSGLLPNSVATVRRRASVASTRVGRSATR
ncbi:MAG: hypothetical protein R2845_13590 [Thermomicrobiales bacterium]